MNEIPLTESTLAPRPPRYIQLPFDASSVVNVTTYRVESKKYPRWQFWRSEKIKFNLAILTADSRFYILDPDNLTLTEKY